MNYVTVTPPFYPLNKRQRFENPAPGSADWREDALNAGWVGNWQAAAEQAGWVGNWQAAAEEAGWVRRTAANIGDGGDNGQSTYSTLLRGELQNKEKDLNEQQAFTETAIVRLEEQVRAAEVGVVNLGLKVDGISDNYWKSQPV